MYNARGRKQKKENVTLKMMIEVEEKGDKIKGYYKGGQKKK